MVKFKRKKVFHHSFDWLYLFYNINDSAASEAADVLYHQKQHVP